MPGDTNIEWADKTWNVVTGCDRSSPGCNQCYAEPLAKRFAGTKALPNGFAVTPPTTHAMLYLPSYRSLGSGYPMSTQNERSDEDILAELAARLRRSLAKSDSRVSFKADLPRATAELVAVLLEAESKGGAVVVPARSEFTTAQAAAILSVSRPTVLRLIDEGKLECRWVGSHRRIPSRSVIAFQEAEAVSRAEARESLARLSNELGLVG